MLEMQETWVLSLCWEDSPRGGNGSPFQYSCMGNFMDRGAWGATVHGVEKTWTGISTAPIHIFVSLQLFATLRNIWYTHTHTHTHTHIYSFEHMWESFPRSEIAVRHAAKFLSKKVYKLISLPGLTASPSLYLRQHHVLANLWSLPIT